MRLQLWSYNYDPEPTGIGPVSRVWAEAMRDLGHEVEVVAAHPHYPSPEWGSARLPYREERGGIPVLRLPLMIGRATTVERLRQEMSFAASQTLAIPALRRPDVMVVVSPSFPALLPAMVNSGTRRIPWVLWLHDILPDGAESTGLVREGAILDAARWLERTAYSRARRVVVLSSAFERNLRSKGVPADKIRLIYDPATRAAPDQGGRAPASPPRVLSMGNIGFSQGLKPLVRAWEASEDVARAGAEFVITGNGVAAEEVRAEIRSDKVRMLGLVSDEEMDQELRAALIALVSQVPQGSEFNIPSKIMNFMAYGLPVIGVVNPASEVAHILTASGGGWVVDSADPDAFPRCVAEVLGDPQVVARRGRLARDFANRHFSREGFAERFQEVLLQVAAPGWRRARRVE
jgi:colanic acid biosynthesis glycosyl transferase WcaI